MTEGVDDTLARAEALRGRLRHALEQAQAALTSAEDANRRLHRELDRMTGSNARRVLVGARAGVSRVGRALRHPFWTSGTLLRGAAATRGPATARRAVQYLVRRTFPLRLSSPARRWSEGADESIAMRWIGPMNLRHTVREALLCHPPAGLEYRARVPGGSRFVCDCALSPQIWEHHPPSVQFTIAVEVPALNWRREIALTVDPGRRWTDRRWHQVSVPVPDGHDGLDVTVSLSTRVESASEVGHAWAVFGEPRFEWSRSQAEVRRSIKTFAARLRTSGMRNSLELLRSAGIATPDAEAYPRWIARHTRDAGALAALREEVAALPHQPLISIITPVYNTPPQWLRACIESVKRQAYPNWELCLCDDASNVPATIEVLREYERDPRIRIRYLSSNSGISSASNAALELARGELVAMLDHDDELAPDALAEVVKHVNAHPDAVVIYSDEDKVDLQGSRCDAFFKPDWSHDHFLTCMYICHLLVLRRTAVDDAGGFRTGYEGAQDYDLVLRILDRLGDRTDRVHHIPRVLYHWRKLPESTASAGVQRRWPRAWRRRRSRTTCTGTPSKRTSCRVARPASIASAVRSEASRSSRSSFPPPVSCARRLGARWMSSRRRSPASRRVRATTTTS
jgi:hypothetical protein